jgi:tetratricopeptide (TPR) repeat protein
VIVSITAWRFDVRGWIFLLAATGCMLPIAAGAQSASSANAVQLAREAQEQALGIATLAARERDPEAALAAAAAAIDTARRALAIDDTLTIAHLALGLAHRQTWQWNQAQAAFDRAFELDPTNLATTFNASWLHAFRGHHDAARVIAEKGVSSHPDAASAHRDLGIVLAYAGEVRAAAESLQRCIDIDPGVGVCHIYLGFMQFRLGSSAGAENQLREAERGFGSGMSPAAASSLAHAYSRIGALADAQRLFDMLVAMESERIVGAGSWPLGYLAIGDDENAYDSLVRAVHKAERHEPDEGFFNLMIIKANVQANPVLDEPRFVALRARIGGE